MLYYKDTGLKDSISVLFVRYWTNGRISGKNDIKFYTAKLYYANKRIIFLIYNESIGKQPKKEAVLNGHQG